MRSQSQSQGQSDGVTLHSVSLDVRVTDLNYGNHLGNDAVLGYLHQGRASLLDAFGWREADVGGVGLIMRSCQIDFLAEGFLFDELRLDVGLTMMGRARCQFAYRLVRLAGAVVIATATTEMAFFDYETRKAARAPIQFVQRLQQLNQV